MVSRGFKKRGVGVMGLRNVRNPVLLARKMIEHGDQDLQAKLSLEPRSNSTKPEATLPLDAARFSSSSSSSDSVDVASAQGHKLIYGVAAEKLAERYGCELVDQSYFYTQKRWDEHVVALEQERLGNGVATWDAEQYLPQGTCGAVAIDKDGVICAATSTGGLTNKISGRVGDTPLPGFWAEEWSEAADPTSAYRRRQLPDDDTEEHRQHITAHRSIGLSGTGTGD